MPDRPTDAAAPPLTILVLPGVSLMEIQPLAAGLVVVRCPACGASQVLTTGSTGAIVPATFVHEDDDYPILLRIQAALARLRAALGAEQN